MIFHDDKMFIETSLCNPMTYIFKEHAKIVNVYMVKFSLSIFNTLKVTVFLGVFFSDLKCIQKPNVISNTTVTKLVTILTKTFFPYLNPTSYLKSSSIN